MGPQRARSLHARTVHRGGRRRPVGAEVRGDGADFRVWAPGHQVEVALLELDGAVRETVRASPEADGYHRVVTPARAGDLYAYRLDGKRMLPDPASRFQPWGPHGPSVLVDPEAYRWRDHGWRGPDPEDQILYEMHVGTFTEEGTWHAAREHLPDLAALGVTSLEVMPVCEAAGDFGWGYDGVDLFAPSHGYGSPDEMRRFVDDAHRAGLGVLLDVVYNHLGPDGNHLASFSPHYFTDRYENEWGDAVDFDGPHSGPVRDFFTANARYWVDEFHVDGFRFDAAQQTFDASPEHILRRIVREVREEAALAGRRTYCVVENEGQDPAMVHPPEADGFGADASWNEDFHRAAHVALTGHNDAYFSDYAGTAQELAATVRHGFLYQGQWYAWQGKRRGRPSLHLPQHRFVHYLENHDQVANNLHGARMHQRAAPGPYRAMTALLLLSPQTPMLFQGQEFGCERPFLYFADHEPALAEGVRRGRQEFLSQFPSLRAARGHMPDPTDPESPRRCALPPRRMRRTGPLHALHRDLLRLRRTDPVFSRRRAARLDAAALSERALAVRWDRRDAARLVLVNLGGDWSGPLSQPLLAPPHGPWRLLWASEDPEYGGQGQPDCDFEAEWRVPAGSAVVLASEGAP